MDPSVPLTLQARSLAQSMGSPVSAPGGSQRSTQRLLMAGGVGLAAAVLLPKLSAKFRTAQGGANRNGYLVAALLAGGTYVML